MLPTEQQQKASLKPDTRKEPHLNKVLSPEDTVWLTTQLHWHSLPGRLQGETKVRQNNVSPWLLLLILAAVLYALV